MKILNIPAYSYFANIPCYHEIDVACDTALINALFDTYGTTRTRVINISQDNINLRKVINNFFNVEVLPYKHPLTNFVFNDTCNSTAMPATWGWLNQLKTITGLSINDIHVSNNYACGSTSTCYPSATIALNGDNLYSGNNTLAFGTPIISSLALRSLCGLSTFVNIFEFYDRTTYLDCNFDITIYPDEFFNDVGFVQTAPTGSKLLEIEIDFRAQRDTSTGLNIEGINQLQVYVRCNTSIEQAHRDLKYILGNFHFKNSMAKWEESDEDNPYGEDGNSYEGGGDGTLGPGGLDYIDPTEIPEVPTLSAASCGFMTMYNPTVQELQALSAFMWSSAFDLDTYKKLFSDPMESIIGLAIVPVAPDTGAYQNVKFGTITSDVAMNVISNQYKKVNCGSVDIQKYVGCFMDYSPYTKISIYLPYIGIRDLSPDDLMGGSINVTYIVDVLTGSCACFISHSVKGVLYAYNGSCITNVPLTAQNFSGAIQNAVSAVISGVGVIAGAATGAAPITAMGAMGLLNSAANTAMNSKPHIQRSGNLGGSAGIMSVQKPFIIIERPNLSVPSNVQHYVGQTSNLTRNLGNCSGFTMVEYIHLHDIPATSEELSEVETLLKQGVIL